MTPIINKLTLPSTFPDSIQEVYFTQEGSAALARLIKEMARIIDEEINNVERK